MLRGMVRLATLIAIVALGTSGCGKKVRVATPEEPRPTSMQQLIPAPASVSPASGEFVIAPETVVLVTPGDDRVRRVGEFLSDLIGIAAGPARLRVEPTGTTVPPNSIQLAIGTIPGGRTEAYELTVSPERVAIVGSDVAGLFNGVQTFRQLLPPWVEHEAVRADKNRRVFAPAGKITDSPRYGWRGAMLDVARHFFTVEEVKRYIDLLALYKMNRLHLHLADDQGWRIEIKSWPNLTAYGGTTEVGGGPGGYYTQEEYSDLVEYAGDRNITIVPEIDMPGHTNAALASYAELNCNGVAPPLYTGIEVGFSALCVESEITYKFIDDVVREIGALTSGPYFHVGGDEVERLSGAQYVAFIERVQGIVQSHGKQMIGWDEVASARLLPTSIVQIWRPKAEPGPAVMAGAKVIVSAANRLYLDMKYHDVTAIGLNWAGNNDLPDAYTWDPGTLIPGIAPASILGIEAPLWSETLSNIRDVEFLVFPRLAGVAEIAWSQAGERDWDRFKTRLGAQAARWSALGINYYRSPLVPWQD
jgi:hexosaminidase